MNLLYSQLKPHHTPKLPWIILILLILILLLPLAWLTLRPTGSYLNPQPRGLEASAPNTPGVKTLAFYLGTAQTSLTKARQLANTNSYQTDSDKQQIIALLNQALAAANQAVATYPKDPRAYQQRAEILVSVAHLDPSVTPLAEQDLRTAQSLSAGPASPAGGQLPQLPAINSIQTLPIEQASLAQNLIIAAPASQGDSLPEQGVALHSNVTKSTVILPAGQTELTTDNWKLKTNSVIYLIPQGPTLNHPLYIKSKTSASFTLAIDQPLAFNLTIDYWIINNDN